MPDPILLFTEIGVWQRGNMALLGITCAWLAGFAAAGLISFTWWQWLVIGLVSAAFAIFNRPHRVTRYLFASLAALALAGSWFNVRAEQIPRHHISRLNDSGVPLLLEGVVADPPQRREEYAGLLIDLRNARTQSGETVPVTGQILLYAPPTVRVRYGDVIEFSASPETPPTYETFDYRRYLERQGVYSVATVNSLRRLASGAGPLPMRSIFRFRQHARQTIFRLFPQPESSLLAGILIGDEYSIPEPVRNAFNRTGTTHIIAISGFNITIIAALFLGLFQRPLGARWGTAAALTGIVTYTLLVGADAAVVRAAIMSGLAFLAIRLGRQDDALSALAASAFLMTLIQPQTFWDVGFQLSFAATLGLVLYGQPMQMRLVLALQHRWRMGPQAAQRLGQPLGEFVLFTLAAQLTTLPLSALYFGRLPLTSLLANPLILPLQPVVMIVAGLATLLGMIWLPLGQLLAWIGWAAAALTIRVVELFSGLPLASAEISTLPPYLPPAFYAALFVLTVPRVRGRSIPALLLRRAPVQVSQAALAGALALGTLISWSLGASAPDGHLHVTELDSGEGMAILVRSPTGRNLLINGGASAVELEQALGRRLGIFQRELDWIIVTELDEANTGGLRNLPERMGIGAALVPAGEGDRSYTTFVGGLSAADRPIVTARRGMVLPLGGAAFLEVLWAGERSCIVQITLDRARFVVLTDRPLGRDLADVQIGSSAIFVPGEQSLSSWLPLFERSLPLVVVSARAEGPAARVPVAQYPAPPLVILRSDLRGWVKFETDGTDLWAYSEHHPAAIR